MMKMRQRLTPQDIQKLVYQETKRKCTLRKVVIGKYEESNVDLLMAKSDTLSQMIDKIENVMLTFLGTLHPCYKLCGMQAHTTVDCPTIMSNGQN